MRPVILALAVALFALVLRQVFKPHATRNGYRPNEPWWFDKVEPTTADPVRFTSVVVMCDPRLDTLQHECDCA